MLIRSCPRCNTSKLQMSGTFVETHPLPIWFHPQAVIALAVVLGAIGGGFGALNSLFPGRPPFPLFVPWLFIIVAAIGGWVWYKLRMRYGYMLYRVRCLTCGHQWAVEERG